MQRVKYKIDNWRDYNKGLINRGKITLWIEDGINESWTNSDKSGKRGRSYTYSDKAMELCLTLKYLYKLPYRATEGWVNSLFELMSIDLKSPSYTQMQRRSKKLNIKLNSKIRSFYQRLREKGKKAKVAITACIRKFLIILNAILRNAYENNLILT